MTISNIFFRNASIMLLAGAGLVSTGCSSQDGCKLNGSINGRWTTGCSVEEVAVLDGRDPKPARIQVYGPDGALLSDQVMTGTQTPGPEAETANSGRWATANPFGPTGRVVITRNLAPP